MRDLRALLVILIALLAGCVSVQPGQRIEFWTDCAGKRHAADVEVRVGLPAIACPALAAEHGNWGDVAMFLITGPALGCAFVWQPYREEPLFTRAIVFLPPYAIPELIEHEMRHVRGVGHGEEEGC